MRILLTAVVSIPIACVVLSLPGAKPAQAEEQPAVSAALQSIFSPRRSPAQRTMGLTQRTFLDLVEQSGSKLEISLVIDGTESMGASLRGVREALAPMFADLERYRPGGVAYQLVVYRDAASPSGPFSFPLDTVDKAFTTDRDALMAALDKLTAESGAPYFPERIDQGVHEALTQLPWSEASAGEEVTRWVLLFGDAPPFDATMSDENSEAKRTVATETLVALAAAKDIRISCVLCPSREEDQSAYEAMLDQTRAFMNALSTGSGGLMLDLSYDDISDALVESAKGPAVEYSPVGTITREEVLAVRAALLEPASPSDRPIKVAVLPHAALDDMSFASNSAAARMATEMRLRMKAIPGMILTEPLLVERRFNQLRRNPSYSGLRGVPLIQALGRTLGADYVLWGTVSEAAGRRGQDQSAESQLYDVGSGEIVASAQRALGGQIAQDQIATLLARDLMSTSITTAAHRPLAMHLAAATRDDGVQGVVTRTISNSAAHRDLVSGLGALERALGYVAGDQGGARLLAEARERLTRAAEADDTNALPHFLLASCLFNLAKQAEGDESDQLLREFGSEIRSAYRFRNDLDDDGLRREIEADYALLVRKQPAEAIGPYEQLAAGPAGSDSARRANWMLAGIYSGDWGVGQEHVDRERARDHLIRLLALWPESSESLFIKRALRWDDEAGGSQFQHLPQENAPLAEKVDREA